MNSAPPPVLRSVSSHPFAAATVSATTASAPPRSVAPAPAAPQRAAPTPSAPQNSARSNSELSSPVSRPPDKPSLQQAATSLAVLHQVSPDVPRAIRDRIRGHIKVTVRVLVDPSGNVVGEFLENPGPTRYFARLAGDAAIEWKFAPADIQGSRVWLLRFEFDRLGVTVQTNAAQ
jgi:outer membrane biosynthesis protein TonB